MQINQKGIDLVKSFEGLRLEAYLDAVGIPTIGYGSTRGVKLGQKITKEEAEELLKKELDEFSGEVEKLLKISVTENEFSALVSFAYNVGVGALGRSTLLRKLNAGDKEGAAKEFFRWNMAGGRVLEGLKRRRAAEAGLFLTKGWFFGIITVDFTN